MSSEKQSDGRTVSVYWFRHGLRLHDNPALRDALNGSDEFYAVFIFDGESAGTKKIGYNRMRFLLESLNDLDRQLKAVGGRLYMLQGQATQIFQRLKEEIGLTRVCFEQDCEPIWCARDNAVKTFCEDSGTEVIERVSHTLWDPKTVISTNGGMPPLTYQMFLHTVSVIGPPPRPVPDVDWTGVKFGTLPDHLLREFQAFSKIPTPECFGIIQFPDIGERMVHWEGGETNALCHLQSRISVEHEAFKEGYYLPNQARPDLVGPPTSQSAALRFGCLSVRRFYWVIHDLFNEVHKGQPPSTQNITGQLIWREYFYTMSVDNIFYAEMLRNPICLNIPWYKTDEKLMDKWRKGKTGYPFIDAAMRQLLQDGWIHHVARNAVATFLTRGDLWINWEAGLDHFLKYLLDADWSVCAGNWMWVSSSAFEQLLDCSYCMSPVKCGQRLDPWGVYVKRYVPELRNFPVEFLYEPWRASLEIQKKAGCIIGKDYPEPMVNHQEASEKNREMMTKIRKNLMGEPPHCCPSNREEVRQFMWLPDSCNDHICPP